MAVEVDQLEVGGDPVPQLPASAEDVHRTPIVADGAVRRRRSVEAARGEVDVAEAHGDVERLQPPGRVLVDGAGRALGVGERPGRADGQQVRALRGVARSRQREAAVALRPDLGLRHQHVHRPRPPERPGRRRARAGGPSGGPGSRRCRPRPRRPPTKYCQARSPRTWAWYACPRAARASHRSTSPSADARASCASRSALSRTNLRRASFEARRSHRTADCAQRGVGFGAVLLGQPERRAVVMRQQLPELAGPLTGDLLEPLGDLGVRDSPVAQRDGVVGDVARQDVLEDVLLLPGERRPDPVAHQLAVLQVAQALVELRVEAARLGRARREPAHRSAPEHPPDHRGGLEGALVRRDQQVDAGGEHALHRVGQVDLLDPRLGPPPAVLAGDQPPVDEPAQDLLEEERVALRALEDPGVQRARQVLDAEQQPHEQLGIRRPQRVQGDGDRVAPAASPARDGSPPGRVATGRRRARHPGSARPARRAGRAAPRHPSGCPRRAPGPGRRSPAR